MASYQFFQNRQCPYFPCHNINEEELNCMFCYCPLYVLKEDCGGHFVYLENGIKDCSYCTKPHGKDGYEHIMKHINTVVELSKK